MSLINEKKSGINIRFFEGWKEDIVSVDEFDDFYKALKWYKKEWFEMAENFKEFTSKSGLQTAFWQ
ncbi:DUF1033 family protein, partial [Citrobacter sp. TBCS-11]